MVDRQRRAVGESGIGVAERIADGLDPYGHGLAVHHERAMDVLQAAHREHWSYRLGLIRMYPWHERRHCERRSHVGLLEPQHSQLSFPGRDHQDECERPIVFDEHSEGHVADLASGDTMEGADGRASPLLGGSGSVGCSR